MYRLQYFNPMHDRYGYLSLVAFGAAVLLLGLLLRSDFFLSIVNFVLEIIGWVGILGGAAITTAGVVAFGNERGWWDRLIEFSGQSKKIYPMIRGACPAPPYSCSSWSSSSCPGCLSAASVKRC